MCIVAIHRLKFTSGDKVTSFGKEYLCNDCLGGEPTAVIELQISSTTDDDVIDDVINDSNKYVTTKYGSSVSAPATPARKDLSVAARMTDGDSSLDMSTRSLLDTSDGM